MAKILTEINIRCAKNGFLVSPYYREDDPKKSKGDFCCGPSGNDQPYVCTTRAMLDTVLDSVLGKASFDGMKPIKFAEGASNAILKGLRDLQNDEKKEVKVKVKTKDNEGRKYTAVSS